MYHFFVNKYIITNQRVLANDLAVGNKEAKLLTLWEVRDFKWCFDSLVTRSSYDVEKVSLYIQTSHTLLFNASVSMPKNPFMPE